MSVKLNNIDGILEVFHKIEAETRPVLKMSIISSAMLDKQLNEDLELLLSIGAYKILECPKPKWKNASTPSEAQCLAVLKRMLTDGNIDTKEFHELPIKVQAVLYNCSKGNNLGLNISHFMSCINIYSTQSIYDILDIELSTSSDNLCSKCGMNMDGMDGIICWICYNDIKIATEYRVESFEVYGTNIRDFSVTIRDFKVDVSNGLFKFTKLNDSIEQYEPLLPFDEYVKTLQLI